LRRMRAGGGAVGDGAVMIKARGDGVVLLGFSRQNVERMLADMAIRFNGAEIGLPGLTFVIVADETEQAIETKLREAGVVTHETQVDDRWEKGARRA